MTTRRGLLVLLVTTTLTVECSNFRRPDEGPTLRAMSVVARWAPYGGPPLPAPRMFPSATVTPRGTVLFGGRGARGLIADAWRWGDGRWTALATEGAPSPRTGHAAAWTGQRLCVFGGEAGGGSLGDGACWDPATDRWEPLPTDGAPSPRSGMASVFTGREWLLWGGRDADGNEFDDGARYDVSEGRWSPMPGGGPRARRDAVAALSPDASQVLIWGGAGEALALGAEDAAVLDLATSTWHPVDLAGAPPARSGPVAVVVPGGLVALGPDGVARFDWGARRWRSVEAFPLPARWGATVVAVEGAVVVWGGRDEAGLRGDGAVLDLATERWTALHAEGAPSARMSAVGVADGAGAVVLWGGDGTTLLGDGFALR